jgi:nucleoside-diphosphate kinase
MRTDVTFTIIKPIALKHNSMGPIFEIINRNGFMIIAMKLIKMDKALASEFYKEHAERSFFNELIDFMTSGPVVVAVLQKENAVDDFRELIGNTDPALAKPGTIRRMYAESKAHNAIHGSDSIESAEREINIFFQPNEILSY